MPEMTYNFKRIERYNHAKPPVFLVRILTLFASFLIGLTLMGILLFNDLEGFMFLKITLKLQFKIKIKIHMKINSLTVLL